MPQNYLKFGLHYDNLFKSAVLINLTHKKTFLKRQNFSRFSFGDNIRYNLDYYIEQGFNLSLDSSPSSINSIEM
jgi:NTE family protein